MPARGPVGVALPRQLGETVFVTVHPEHLPPALLRLVDWSSRSAVTRAHAARFLPCNGKKPGVADGLRGP